MRCRPRRSFANSGADLSSAPLESRMNNLFSFDNFALTFVVGLIVFCWVVFLTVLFA